jgi:ArsR family transcriptional regulator
MTPEEVSFRMPDEETLYELADLFRVFGDSTRIKILCALSVSDLCVADIASLLSMNQSAISHQLRVLKQARLVRVSRKGRSSVYALDDDHVRTIFDQGFRHVRHIAPSSEGGEQR